MEFIPVLLLALVILCLCGFLGSGALVLFCIAEKKAADRSHKDVMQGSSHRENKKQKPGGGADALLTGELILTGLAVTAHVAAVFTGQSFSRCTAIFISLLGAGLLFNVIILLCHQITRQKISPSTYKFLYGITHRKKRNGGEVPAVRDTKRADAAERILAGIFWILVIMQFVYLLWNAGVYTAGDMTVETVGSFLQTDSIYQVNPMTGQEYTEGIPSRLKILCLPSLYGFFCRLSGLSSESVVTAAVPVWIFVSSYAAFFCVGKSLFPESGKKRSCFMITIVMLIWAGRSFYSMDGFNLLYCGYRGVTFRNLVIIPYLISLCLQKKWMRVILCVLAEACIVWTFYGLGTCLLTAAGLFVAERRYRNGRAS